MLTESYLGANGIFVAIIIGLLVGYGFSKLTKIDKLQIKMPDQVPPEVSKSFMIAIPTAIIIILTSVIAYCISLIEPQGLNALVYAILQAPIQSLGATPFTPMILIFMAMILWSVGIHGTFTVSPIYITLYASMNIANISYAAQAGTTAGSPYPYTWFALFENYGCIGGTGNTLALIVAILILSRKKGWKRADYTKTAKIGLIPGLFCINEPIIFGLPIVLNPIMFLPFVFVPVINAIIGYFCDFLGFGVNHLVVLNSGVEPIFVNAWVLGAFTISPVILCVVLFIIDLILYYPFVKLQIKQNSIEAQNEGVVLE